MKTMHLNTLLILLGLCLLLSACAGTRSNSTVQAGTDTSSVPSEQNLPTPTKKIVVTRGDINKSYDILGEVECSLEGKSIYESNLEKEVEDLCKKVAFSKYKNQVDAIINMTVTADIGGGFWGRMGVTYGARTMTYSGSGIAIHFK